MAFDNTKTLSKVTKKNYIRVIADFMKSLYKSSINLLKLYPDWFYLKLGLSRRINIEVYMMQKRKLDLGLYLCLTPLVAGSVLAASPSLAATLASSEARVNIGNFSQNPFDVSTNTGTNTFTIATQGTVTANANADAVFPVNPSLPGTPAFNTSLSQANGAGVNYFGLAQSNAALIGYNFLVQSNNNFSFDFQAFLDLKTSIDNSSFERANADGGVSFQLYDTTDSNNWLLLDTFSLDGKIATLGNGDFLHYQGSDSVTVNPNQTSFESSFGGTKESAKASVVGKYSRQFERLTSLTLIEAKANQVTVEAKVPEPSSLMGLLLFGLGGISYGLKKKN